MKRIVFISFRCTSKSIESSDDDEIDDNEYEVNNLPPQSSWLSSFSTANHSNNGKIGANGIISQNKSQTVDMKPVHTVIGLVLFLLFLFFSSVL